VQAAKAAGEQRYSETRRQAEETAEGAKRVRWLRDNQAARKVEGDKQDERQHEDQNTGTNRRAARQIYDHLISRHQGEIARVFRLIDAFT